MKSSNSYTMRLAGTVQIRGFRWADLSIILWTITKSATKMKNESTIVNQSHRPLENRASSVETDRYDQIFHAKNNRSRSYILLIEACRSTGSGCPRIRMRRTSRAVILTWWDLSVLLLSLISFQINERYRVEVKSFDQKLLSENPWHHLGSFGNG